MKTSTLNIRPRCPAIRVKLGKEMTINKMVLHALNDPKNLQLWWSKSEDAILIGGVAEKTHASIGVGNYCYKTKQCLKLVSRKLLKTILNTTNWNNNAVYVIVGEYVPTLDMVAFKLNDTVELEVEANE